MAAAVERQPAEVETTAPLDQEQKSILWTMKDGARVEIRPIQPKDEERMVAFHKGLSERSVYMRYFESLSFSLRTAHARLARICFADPERQVVLVALIVDRQTSDQKIVAVGR